MKEKEKKKKNPKNRRTEESHLFSLHYHPLHLLSPPLLSSLIVNIMSSDVHGQQRRLKLLQACLKSLLAARDNPDLNDEGGIHLDRFCLALESCLKHGIRGFYLLNLSFSYNDWTSTETFPLS